jgi:glutathione S-transferase
MNTRLELVSHKLCPYVQRVAIALAEKGASYERIHIDLADKPDWFIAISPLARVPLLKVDGAVLFESAAICDYLDDTARPAGAAAIRDRGGDAGLPRAAARLRARPALAPGRAARCGLFYRANGCANVMTNRPLALRRPNAPGSKRYS